jgi:acyl-CoA dehydrogenase
MRASLTIYEGTNGIQAIDLVHAQAAALQQGPPMRAAIADLHEQVRKVAHANMPGFGQTGQRLREALESLERATAFMLEAVATRPGDALAGASDYLRLFGLALGGTALAQKALAGASGPGDSAGHLATARFFAEHLATGAPGLERAIVEGAGAVHDGGAALTA